MERPVTVGVFKEVNALAPREKIKRADRMVVENRIEG